MEAVVVKMGIGHCDHLWNNFTNILDAALKLPKATFLPVKLCSKLSHGIGTTRGKGHAQIERAKKG